MRARVSIQVVGKLFKVTIDWVNVVDNQPEKTIFSEGFLISPEKLDEGCMYLSRVEVIHSILLPGTLWIDGKNLRHFITMSDKGKIETSGEDPH